ncbi:unnamed protein product, partial [Prorocentrum cordatum]
TESELPFCRSSLWPRALQALRRAGAQGAEQLEAQRRQLQGDLERERLGRAALEREVGDLRRRAEQRPSEAAAAAQSAGALALQRQLELEANVNRSLRSAKEAAELEVEIQARQRQEALRRCQEFERELLEERRRSVELVVVAQQVERRCLESEQRARDAERRLAESKAMMAEEVGSVREECKHEVSKLRGALDEQRYIAAEVQELARSTGSPFRFKAMLA